MTLVGCGDVDQRTPVADAAGGGRDASAATADAPVVLADAAAAAPDATAAAPDATAAPPDATADAPPPADAAATPDAALADAAPPADAPPPPPPPDAAPPDARPVDAPPPADAAPAADAPGPDATPPPPTTCEPLRLTYYDVTGAGACEVMDVPSALPPIAQAGLTAAIAEPWWNGSFAGGGPAEACGECWEITSAHATRTVVVTDQCPIEGNPVCDGGFFHFDLARTAAVGSQLDYILAGRVEARARRVACPVTGNIFAVIRDGNATFIRLALASPRIAVRLVEYRGAGTGVSATNPWTAMTRDGGPWAAVGGITRGGTGIQLRISSAQGQVVTSSVVFTSAGPYPRAVDLGVQLDDLAAVTGPACPWRVPDPYDDGFGGIDGVRWNHTAWEDLAIDDASAAGCMSGLCYAATLGAWGGVSWIYPEDFARAGLARLVVNARSADAAPIEIVLKGPAGDCTGVSATLGASWKRIEINLATACAAVPRLKTIQVQVMRASGGSFVLDDVAFEE